eukprot:NODE_719_length_4821_cov_0.698009.p3 type:complete len:245 gc:universal NODE_719_length_4821_cov_0.698009:795-1529(+)
MYILSPYLLPTIRTTSKYIFKLSTTRLLISSCFIISSLFMSSTFISCNKHRKNISMCCTLSILPSTSSLTFKMYSGYPMHMSLTHLNCNASNSINISYITSAGILINGILYLQSSPQTKASLLLTFLSSEAVKFKMLFVVSMNTCVSLSVFCCPILLHTQSISMHFGARFPINNCNSCIEYSSIIALPLFMLLITQSIRIVSTATFSMTAVAVASPLMTDIKHLIARTALVLLLLFRMLMKSGM